MILIGVIEAKVILMRIWINYVKRVVTIRVYAKASIFLIINDESYLMKRRDLLYLWHDSYMVIIVVLISRP